MRYYGSIRNRLIGIILLVTTITVFIGYGGFIYWFINDQKAKSIDMSHTIGLVLSQNIAKLTLLKDVSVAVDITSSLESFPKLNRCVIYNENKKPIYTYSKEHKSFKVNYIANDDKKVIVQNKSVEIYTSAKYKDTKLGYIYLEVEINNAWCVVKDNYQMILLLWIIMFIVSYRLAIYYAKEFTNPILKLVSFLEEVDNIEMVDKSILITQNNEFGKLYHEVNVMLGRIKESNNALKEHQNNLENIIYEKTQENIKQLEILQQQSKLASMGEMIGAIAHQWRQPLSEISTSIQNLKYDYMEGKLTDEIYVKEFIDKNKKTIKFMSKTIDDFRSFFRIDKQKVDFKVKETTQAVIDMQSAQLKNNHITLNMSGDEFIYHGLQSEYQQVILNIINNSKDALIQNNISNPTINILVKSAKISIEDNAGGIPQDIIDRIFEPYFTTKVQGSGTGMGLYIAKMIIEDNMGAILSVRNNQDGALFVIDLEPKEINIQGGGIR